MKLPDISFALPLGSESRWSDLLAVLIATDPEPIAALLGLHHDPAAVMVQREVAAEPGSRPDIVLAAGGDCAAVIEVKVLAGLGAGQLERYRQARPGAGVYAVIYPGRLVIPLPGTSPWRGWTWETVLTACIRSAHPWVAVTARAWLAHLDTALPKVGPDTIWNDLLTGEDFVVALRARMSWLFSQLSPPPGVSCDLAASSAGVSWVARLRAATAAAGYTIVVEIEENLPVRDFPKYASPDGRQPLGPSAKVCLCQEGVTTSAGFDWDYLRELWPVMQHARADWVTNRARPKAAHDRQGHARIVAAGAPPFLGIGFGEGQTKINRFCMFGARIQFAATITLAQLRDETAELAILALKLARAERQQETA